MRNQKYKLLYIIMQEKIESRCKTSCSKNLRQWYGISTGVLYRAAADKTKIMIANVLGNRALKEK